MLKKLKKSKKNLNLQKQLYIYKCLSICSSVHQSVTETPQELEIIIPHHSSFNLHCSSFILPSTFLHFATFKLITKLLHNFSDTNVYTPKVRLLLFSIWILAFSIFCNTPHYTITIYTNKGTVSVCVCM